MSGTSSFEIHQPCFRLPVVNGMIERRMLVNFRCEPVVLARLLPTPFRPKLVNGLGMAGICLIRLGEMRPAFLPALCGLTSENAAHRTAVEWDEDGVTREGVFIPRRDTNALLNRLAGGKFFPGVHHAAKFEVSETNNHFKLEMRSEDGEAFIRVTARVTDELPDDSVFGSRAEALDFFAAAHWAGRRVRRTMNLMDWNCAAASGGWNLWRSEKSNLAFLKTPDCFHPARWNLTARFSCAASRTNGTRADGSPLMKRNSHETTHHPRR